MASSRVPPFYVRKNAIGGHDEQVASMRVTTDHADPSDQAWDAFVTEYSRLILRVARTVTRDHDSAMDCYVHVLDRLRENGGARLKSYAPASGCSYTTWLAVVVRRLCVDRYRERYGRSRRDDQDSRDARDARRRLADLLGVDAPLERVRVDDDAVMELEHRELVDALSSVLARLTARDRALLAFRYEDDLSARQIAEIMSFPSIFHVYRRLSSVLRTCRDALERQGIRASDG